MRVWTFGRRPVTPSLHAQPQPRMGMGMGSVRSFSLMPIESTQLGPGLDYMVVGEQFTEEMMYSAAFVDADESELDPIIVFAGGFAANDVR